jgi:prepilin-type N-terminal cleavage/methylation domain-containing protein
MSKKSSRLSKWVLRRGMTMIEIAAAVAMLGVLLASSAQVMRSLANQQRAAARRVMALQTVQALIEELANVPWDRLSPEVANKLTIPDVAKLYLPGAALLATVTDAESPVESKCLSVELRWRTPSGQPTAPLRLTTWVFSDETKSPQ